MAYDEEQHKRSRVVIETPAARREVVQTTTARVPERRGISGGAVAALVIGSVALVTILFLVILNRQNSDTTTVDANVRTSTAATPAQQPVVIQQQPTPVPQQPIIIQQPAPVADQPPVIIQQPAPPVTTSGTTTASKPSGSDDIAIQSEIDKRVSQDATLSTADITPTVIEGKVTLIGTVESQAIKNQAERLVKAIKGVKAVDNQLIVSAPQ
jgi:BON domain